MLWMKCYPQFQLICCLSTPASIFLPSIELQNVPFEDITSQGCSGCDSTSSYSSGFHGIRFCSNFACAHVPFAGKGVVLYSFLSSQYTNDEQTAVRDDYNSWSSGIVSAINLPTGWLISSMMPVCFLALVSNYHAQCKRKFGIAMTFMAIDTFIRYLINNGFQAVNVQIAAQQLRANIATTDLRVSTDVLDIMLYDQCDASYY